jgi:predicted MPP superfamily phosphohydrolase
VIGRLGLYGRVIWLSVLFWSTALLASVGFPLYAWRVRGRAYAIFALVVLAISLPGAILTHWRLAQTVAPVLVPWLDAAFVLGMISAAAHLTALTRPRLRPTPFRWAISLPGMTFIAGGALAGLWLLALMPVRGILLLLGADGALAALRWLDVTPLVVAGLSVVTSSRPVAEVVRIAIASDGPDSVTRMPVERYRRRSPVPLADRPLHVVQITDPHLGPWQPVDKLRRCVADLIGGHPDLVLLTGDFLTMEGAGTPGALAEAMSPLAGLTGRCFAVFGNHDHEAPAEVRGALERNGIQLLLDDEAIAETEVGPVQIVGIDYRSRERRAHIEGVLARFPRRPATLRLVLLHDPSAFKYVPKGEADLVLSGHTHGGQLGLLSFGIDWTVLRRTSWPDHGLFGHGSNRLYVHRGTGFYGFPLRVGVPGEASRLELVVK